MSTTDEPAVDQWARSEVRCSDRERGGVVAYVCVSLSVDSQIFTCDFANAGYSHSFIATCDKERSESAREQVTAYYKSYQ